VFEAEQRCVYYSAQNCLCVRSTKSVCAVRTVLLLHAVTHLEVGSINILISLARLAKERTGATARKHLIALNTPHRQQ